MLKLIKESFLSLRSPYKHFFHWNISKLVIFFYSIVLSFLFALPFLVLFLIYTLFSDVLWSEIVKGFLSGNIPNFISQHVLTFFPDFIIGSLLLLIAILSAYLAFGYSRVLLIHLSDKYISGEKIGVFKNYFLDFSRIFGFVRSGFIRMFFVSIPFIVYILVIFLLVLLFGGTQSVKEELALGQINTFSIITLALGIISLVIAGYIYFRLYFLSYDFAIDYKKNKGAIDYVKHAWKSTKGCKKLSIFLSLVVLFFLVMLPFKYISGNNSYHLESIPKYVQYQSLDKEIQNNIYQQNPNFIGELVSSYNGTTNEQLEKKYMVYSLLQILYVLLQFLFVYGIVETLFIKLYRKKIKS